MQWLFSVSSYQELILNNIHKVVSLLVLADNTIPTTQEATNVRHAIANNRVP